MARKFLNGVDVTGTAVIATAATSSGSQTALTVTPSADTAQTASTEKPDIYLNLARTVQFATGALTTQRAVRIRAPTYAFVGASVITTAATLAIEGPPVAGTNATLTNSYPFWVQSGTSRFDGRIQGVLGTPTLVLTTGVATFSRDTDGYVLVVEAPSMTSTPALGLQNMPLSTDLNTGKAFELKVTGEANGRAMFYTDGKYAVGPGSSGRDTVLSRSAANTFRVSSDGSTGAGHFEILGRASAGGALSTTTILNIGATNPLTGVNQTAVSVIMTATSAATSSAVGHTVSLGTAAAAFTCGILMGGQTLDFSKGAGSTITRAVGHFFADQTQGTNNAAVVIGGAATGFTGTYALISQSTNASTFAGVLTSSNLKRGAGTPEGAVTGVVGDIYERTDGGAGTTLYIKESGTGNTGWVAVSAGGGSIGGSITANQVAFGSGANTIQGSSTFTYSATTGLDIDQTTATNVIRIGPTASYLATNTSPFGTNGMRAQLITSGDAVHGLALRNVSSGTAADMRFVVYASGSTADYLAFSMPGTGNTVSTIFGLARNANAFLFTNGSKGLGIGTVASQDVVLGTNNRARLTLSSIGYATAATFTTIAPPAFSGSGHPQALTVTGGTNTAIDGGGGNTDVDFNFARSVQFTGPDASNYQARTFRIRSATFTGTAATVTFSTAATVAISGAPVASTNVTIATPLAFWVESGASQFDGRVVIAGTSTNGTPAQFDMAPTAVATGTAKLMRITGAANTNQTASTEVIDVDFALNRTVQFATGAKTTQRAMVIRPPTYSAVGSTTITTAATLSILGPPVNGSNVTITNAYALQVESGTVSFLDTFLAAGTSTFSNTVTFNGAVVLNRPVSGTINDGSLAAKGVLLSQQAAASGIGDTPMLRLTGGAHTGLTASTELNQVDLAFNQTVQFATGALANQRCVYLRAPTYAFVGSSTLTTAATFAISGAPVAGTNATITNRYALLIESGLLGTAASASGGAGLRIPHGSAPSSPVNGDFWSETTGFYGRVNGATVGPFGAGGGGLTHGQTMQRLAAY